MSDEMVTVATFGNPIEAQMVKNQLEAEGIPSFISGGEASGLFAGLGDALGLIRLLVSERNRLRALAILDKTMEEEPEDEPEEEIEPEPNTSIKAPDWVREPAARAQDNGEKGVQATPKIKEAGAGVRKAATLGEEKDEDYEDDDDDDEPSITRTAEEYATRAWKASIIGLIALPPLLHLYSLGCVIRGLSADEKLSPAGRRKLYGALVVDILAITAVPFLFCGGGLRWVVRL